MRDLRPRRRWTWTHGDWVADVTTIRMSAGDVTRFRSASDVDAVDTLTRTLLDHVCEVHALRHGDTDHGAAGVDELICALSVDEAGDLIARIIHGPDWEQARPGH